MNFHMEIIDLVLYMSIQNGREEPLDKHSVKLNDETWCIQPLERYILRACVLANMRTSLPT